MHGREEYHPGIYTFTSNLQEIIVEVQFLKSQKMTPLGVKKIFFCSKEREFLRYASVLSKLNFEIRYFEHIEDILRTSRLYFSVMVICPEDERPEK